MFPILRAVAAVAVILLSAAPALAGNLNFKLINKSGFTLQEFYVSSAQRNRWGNDVLGKSTLPSGRSASVNFPVESDDCVYDLKMIFDDGDELTDTINLCETTSYTIN